MRTYMKKIFIVLLAFCMLLAMAGCRSGDVTDEDASPLPEEQPDYPAIDESVEYASVVEVTINPAFRFYLDEEQVVLKVECLNEDAQAVCENLELSGERFDVIFSAVLEESVNQGFLVDGKNVNVEVVRNRCEVYAPDVVQNTADIVDDIFQANEVKGDCSVTISAEIVAEQSDTWQEEDVSAYTSSDEPSDADGEPEWDEAENGEDNVCDLCGGACTIVCDLCSGTGTMTETEEREVAVRNDYVCPYCGGVGILDDGMHGGETAVCGFCGGEGKTGSMSGDFRERAYDIQTVTEEVERVCVRCNGEGTIDCPHCKGTGVIK